MWILLAVVVRLYTKTVLWVFLTCLYLQSDGFGEYVCSYATGVNRRFCQKQPKPFYCNSSWGGESYMHNQWMISIPEMSIWSHGDAIVSLCLCISRLWKRNRREHQAWRLHITGCQLEKHRTEICFHCQYSNFVSLEVRRCQQLHTSTHCSHLLWMIKKKKLS